MAFIKQIDHIIINCEKKQDQEELFDLFTKVLQFPVIWKINQFPSTHLTPGGFRSGGFWINNLIIEILYIPLSAPLRKFFFKRPPCFSAIGFETTTLEEAEKKLLKMNKITYTSTIPYALPVSKMMTIGPVSATYQKEINCEEKAKTFEKPYKKRWVTLYKNIFFETKPCKRLNILKKYFSKIFLLQSLDIAHHAGKKPYITFFLTEYNPHYVDIEETRKKAQNAFSSPSKNLLKIKNLDTIVISYNPQEKFYFKQFMNELTASNNDNEWPLSPSIKIKLEKTKNKTGIIRLEFLVENLTQTKDFLIANDLLEKSETNIILGDLKRFKGLKCSFKEEKQKVRNHISPS